MSADYLKFTPETTLSQAVESFNQAQILFAAVLDSGGRLLGTVEAHHLRAALIGETDLQSPVETFMDPDPVVAHGEGEIEKLAESAGKFILQVDEDNRILSLHVVSRKLREEKISRNTKLQQIIVAPEATIKQAVKILDITDWNLVLVVNADRKFLGLVTERDIRDAILEGHDVETPVGKIMNTKPVTAVQGLTKKELLRLMESKIHLSRVKVPVSIKVPILDDENRLKDLAVNDELDPETTLFFLGDDETLFKTEVRSVLITGGAGYIGSILCRKLLARGFRVRVLDNLLYGDAPIRQLYSHPRFELARGDVRHIEEVVSAIKGMDTVVHLAAIVGDSACALGPNFTIECNYLATRLLADICKHHQVNRFLFSSTCSVYGASSAKLSETSGLNPVSLYARSKIYSEQAILDIMDENFSPTILRLGTVYGISPRPRFDLVLNLFVAKAIKEGAITIEGGKQYRPMVHVADVAGAFAACLEAPIEKVRGEVFNVGSNEQNLQILDLGREVVRLIPTAKMEVSTSKTDARDYWVYFDKIFRALSYHPEKTVEQGIRELIEFFSENEGLDFTDDKYYNSKYLSTLSTAETPAL